MLSGTHYSQNYASIIRPTLLSGKAHEDPVHIVVIAVVHWCLRTETRPCGNVV